MNDEVKHATEFEPPAVDTLMVWLVTEHHYEQNRILGIFTDLDSVPIKAGFIWNIEAEGFYRTHGIGGHQYTARRYEVNQIMDSHWSEPSRYDYR